MNATPLRDAIHTLKQQGLIAVTQRQAFEMMIAHHLIEKNRDGGYKPVAPAAMRDTFFIKEHKATVTNRHGDPAPRISTTVYVYTDALPWLAKTINKFQKGAIAA